MRAVPPDELVMSTMNEPREQVIRDMKQAKTEGGWLHQSLSKEQQEKLPYDTCAHEQGVFALNRLQNREAWDDAALARATLVPFQPQEGKSLSLFEEMFHPPVPSLKPFDSCGAFWAINMLADSHHHPVTTAASHKEKIQEALCEVQQVLELYRMEGGGWRMFPGTQQSAPANSYSTVLALLALLECKKAGLPWLGSLERRDQMLQASAAWLHRQFHQDAKAAGWRGTGENRYEVFDGLT